MKNTYQPIELSPREVLDTFMPECLPVIKKNISSLKKQLKEITPICSDWLDRVYEKIFVEMPDDGYRKHFWLPNAKWFCYDRVIDPISGKIKELEQLLKMTQIQAVGTPTAHLDLEKAKQYPLKNLVKINHMGFAKCPFHNEKTASMKIFPDNRFHCFGCSADGDVVDYVMKRDGVDFKTAVAILNK